MVHLRNPFTFAFGFLVSVGFVLALGYVLVDPGVDHSLASRATGTIIFCSCLWFIWRVSGHPTVLLTDSGVVVRNPFRRITVPWRLLGDVTLSDGLTLTVGGSAPVSAWAFSSSVIGDLTGNRSANGARSAIEVARRPGDPSDDAPAEAHLDLGVRTLLVLWAVGLSLAGITWWLDPTSPALALANV